MSALLLLMQTIDSQEREIARLQARIQELEIQLARGDF